MVAPIVVAAAPVAVVVGASVVVAELAAAVVVGAGVGATGQSACCKNDPPVKSHAISDDKLKQTLPSNDVQNPQPSITGALVQVPQLALKARQGSGGGHCMADGVLAGVYIVPLLNEQMNSNVKSVSSPHVPLAPA